MSWGAVVGRIEGPRPQIKNALEVIEGMSSKTSPLERVFARVLKRTSGLRAWKFDREKNKDIEILPTGEIGEIQPHRLSGRTPYFAKMEEVYRGLDEPPEDYDDE